MSVLLAMPGQVAHSEASRLQEELDQLRAAASAALSHCEGMEAKAKAAQARVEHDGSRGGGREGMMQAPNEAEQHPRLAVQECWIQEMEAHRDGGSLCNMSAIRHLPLP